MTETERSEVARLIELERARALAGAEQAIRKLKDGADEEVAAAVRRLEEAVANHQAAAEALGQLSLSTIPQVVLEGGMAWSFRCPGTAFPGPHLRRERLAGFLRFASERVAWDRGPEFEFDETAEHEVFIMVVPKRK